MLRLMYRGRDIHCWMPPAQIPAGVIHAPGSHLGGLTTNPTSSFAYTVEPLGHVLSGAVSRTCVALPCFPRSSPLAPPTPAPVAQVCSSYIELHAWRSAETCTFATFVYAKSPERLLRHVTCSDENRGVRQRLRRSR